MMELVPMTVVETPQFVRQSEGLLSEGERFELKEKNEMKRLVPALVQGYQARREAR